MKSIRIIILALIPLALATLGRPQAAPLSSNTVAMATATNTVTLAPITDPLQMLTAFVTANGEAYTGVGGNLHWKYGPVLGTQVDVIGGGSTNLWRLGVNYSTLFIPAENEQELGLGFTEDIRQAPNFLKHLLLLTTIPREFKLGIRICEPVEIFHGLNGYDWKRTTGEVSAGWSF